MTLRDFNRLTETAKNETIQLWGDQLEEHVVPGYRVEVYQVGDFYVEVYYDSKQEVVRRFRGCTRLEALLGR